MAAASSGPSPQERAASRFDGQRAFLCVDAKGGAGTWTAEAGPQV